MSKKEFLKFNHVETEKHKFHSSKSAIPTDDVNIDMIAVSEGLPFARKGSEYFVSFRK